MRKVTLFINSLTSGGAERVLSVLATELVKQNIEVNLLCIEKDNAYVLPDEVNIRYLSSLSKHDSSLKKLLYLPYLALKVKKYAREHEVEIIQSHIYRANFTNILAKIFGSKHEAQVVEVTSINNLKDGSYSKKINYLLIQLLYTKANLVVFKAQRMKEEFLKNIPLIKKHRVINNPYDIQTIQKLSNAPVDDFNFESNKKYIVTVGRLSAEKRHISLIKALEHLHSNIELILIGDGEEEARLKAYTYGNKLGKRVHFLGKKENPFNYIKHSNVFILSSEGEGFPNVIVEAMICNTPVISTDCISGPREILAPNTDINSQIKSDIELAQNGILYPIDHQESLVKAINTLLNDKNMQKQYQENGLQKSSEYALEKIIKNYKEILCVE